MLARYALCQAYPASIQNARSLLGEPEAREDLPLQEGILELLFAEYLPAFLAASDQIWHHLLSWTKWHIFVHLEALLSDIAGDLVRESNELAEANAVCLFQPELIAQLHGQVAGVGVVRGNEDAVIRLHAPHNVLERRIIAGVSLL